MTRWFGAGLLLRSALAVFLVVAAIAVFFVVRAGRPAVDQILTSGSGPLARPRPKRR